MKARPSTGRGEYLTVFAAKLWHCRLRDHVANTLAKRKANDDVIESVTIYVY